MARVTTVDPERHVVAVADADGGGDLGYDTLVYALGGHEDDHGVPGVAEHAFDIAARPSALRLRGAPGRARRRRECGGGRRRVVRHRDRHRDRRPAVHYALVNGAPTILFVLGDRVVGAVTFDITGGEIATVRGLDAPIRLMRLTEAWRRHEPDTPLIAQW
ncbi:hypothetical protein [Thermomonospora umbrina]|uniref:hypothetical protein n=1 Tax=Thermomonospora umbrina TaxID=111806 RepID=UPI001FE69E69|nr:hypothetical protein [Thermomonospora umbrina]